MYTVFMNSGDSKTLNPHRLSLINLKYQLRHGMKSFNYLMDKILWIEYIIKKSFNKNVCK